MKQPSTRRLFSYKLVKTACAGCKKSRKAQRHETTFRFAKSSTASKHHGCQRRGKTVSASLSRPRSRQRRLRARRPQYQQYHGARRRVLPYRHGRVVHGHRNVRFCENLVLYGLRQFRSRRVQRFLQNAIGLCVLSVFGCYWHYRRCYCITKLLKNILTYWQYNSICIETIKISNTTKQWRKTV